MPMCSRTVTSSHTRICCFFPRCLKALFETKADTGSRRPCHPASMAVLSIHHACQVNLACCCVVYLARFGFFFVSRKYVLSFLPQPTDRREYLSLPFVSHWHPSFEPWPGTTENRLSSEILSLRNLEVRVGCSSGRTYHGSEDHTASK
jgi:hypothetical protein